MSDVSAAEVDFSGMLTRDNWLEWFRRQYAERFDVSSISSQKMLAATMQYRSDRGFDYFDESLVVRENFFTLSTALRKEVDIFVLNEEPMPAIEKFVTLALQLESQQNVSTFANHSDRVDTYLRPLIRSVSGGFDRSLFDFRICYANASKSLCHGIVLMLALLYDESLVERVLQLWTRGDCPGSPSDFADVVECVASSDSEDLLKYPIEWLVSLVRGGESVE